MTDKQNQKLYLLYATCVVIILLHVVGVTCIWVVKTIQTNEFVIDYTDCIVSGNDTCRSDMRKLNSSCVCRMPINLTINLPGEVIVYYELESYDQSDSRYINSKDDKQLSGKLSETPSELCEPYRYDAHKKPIAPCGAIADAMFTDTYTLIYDNPGNGEEYAYVTKLHTGLISPDDKLKFHNPSGNLTVVFQNYSKPINWEVNVYELDKKNPENNGFQNEKFIAWMHTDWKRKPIWRVNTTNELFKNGLPAGPYRLRVGYNYPLYRYDGVRKVILVSSSESRPSLVWQIVSTLLLTVSCLIICLLLITLFVKHYGIPLLPGRQKKPFDPIGKLMPDRE